MDSRCVTVHRNGYLLAEAYWDGTAPADVRARARARARVRRGDGGGVGSWGSPPAGSQLRVRVSGCRQVRLTYSISKVFATTLVGAAEKAGLLDTEDRAANWVEAWRGRVDESQITVDNLLRHDSGRYFEDIADFV